ncbi:MAG TPA: VCBS repeat-containing protein [Bacteroidales bacterium]
MLNNVANAQISFITNGQHITSSNSWDIHLADLNGDGSLDAYFDGVTWFNNGKGVFTKSDLSFGSGDFVSFADLNGDGFVDAISRDSIYLNDGTYHYQYSHKLLSDISMISSVLADINNDGYVDIISCSQDSDRIFMNDGKGNFTNTGKSLGGWGQCSYAFGDINGDGFTDIYVAVPHTPPPTMVHAANKIWFGDGKGNFTEKDHDINGASSRCAILADFNGDGNLDLFLASNGKTGNMIFFNDGKGNFTNSNQQLGNNSAAAKAADFNGDGNLDLFICYGKVPFGDGAPNRIWLNDGKGKFTDSGLRLGNSNSAQVCIGDINGDKKTDAFVVNVKLDNTVSPPRRVACPVEIWLNTLFQCNYLNENKPDTIPLIFGKGVVSIDGENTHACSFSPDGKLLIFSRYPEKKSYVMTCNNGRWSEPAEAFFDGKETAFSPYNDRVFYYKTDGDIYFNEETEESWSNSINSVDSINTPEMEYYPSIAYDGTLFFSRNGKWDEGHIMYSTLKRGKYTSPVDVGLPINNGGASHAYVAPDKSYMIFNSPREGSYTKLDLWISFRNIDGSWTNPQNPGKTINSGADAILCPKITPDGKYLFFTKLNFNTHTGNVYWVSTKFINSLKCN